MLARILEFHILFINQCDDSPWFVRSNSYIYDKYVYSKPLVKGAM